MKNSSVSRRDALKTLLLGTAAGSALRGIPLPAAEAASRIDPRFVSLARARVPEENLFLHFGKTLGSMIEMKDGNLLSVSFAGRCISSDGGESWSEPEALRHVGGQKVRGGLKYLIRLKSGGLGAFFDDGDQRERYGIGAWFGRSDDEGKTWSQPLRVSEPYSNTSMYDAIVTSSGRIVVPVYKLIGKEAREKGRAFYRDTLVRVGHHSYELFFTYCWTYYSDDEGKTWHPNKGKGVWGTGGELFVTLDHAAGGHFRCNEPVMAEVSPGHLLMFFRTPLGRLYQSWSTDDGTSWSSPEPTALASSLAPAALDRIPGTDDLLVVWNQHSADEITRGLQRLRLSSAISQDGGVTWGHRKNVFAQVKGDRAYIEPPPIQAYRAMEFGPKVPPNDIIATYPLVGFWKDRVIIRYRCEELSRLNWEAYNRAFEATQAVAAGAAVDVPPLPGVSTQATLGLPTSWFYT
jgi:hypothetical protein